MVDSRTTSTARRRHRGRLSAVGILIGLIAIAFAILGTVMEEERKSPPARGEIHVDIRIGETEIVKSTRSGWAKLKDKFTPGKPATKPTTDILSKTPATIESQNQPFRWTYVYIPVGFAAATLGVVGWIRHERTRPAMAAISLGLIAICWQWVLYAVAIAVFLMIIGSLS